MSKSNYRFLITLDYDGSKYGGYAKQKHRNTIQNKLEEGLEKILKVKVKTTEASRTDAKVHAIDQKVMFDLNVKVDETKLTNQLNDFFDNTIYVVKIELVSNEFHARYDVSDKTYVYTITKHYTSMTSNYTYFVKPELDLTLIKEAISYLEGKHDFKAFCGAKATSTTTIRTLNYIKVNEVNNNITFTFNADGFLYNMIRLIMGVLIQVGTKNIKPSQIKEILVSERQVNQLMSLPAAGLCLSEINYKNK